MIHAEHRDAATLPLETFHYGRYLAARNAAIMRAFRDGLGVREIGRRVGLSAAQVSRMTRKP